jgi:hypothetical protein
MKSGILNEREPHICKFVALNIFYILFFREKYTSQIFSMTCHILQESCYMVWINKTQTHNWRILNVTAFCILKLNQNFSRIKSDTVVQNHSLNYVKGIFALISFFHFGNIEEKKFIFNLNKCISLYIEWFSHFLTNYYVILCFCVLLVVMLLCSDQRLGGNIGVLLM